ncbi:MFS transporter [Polynucleobacter sp. UK-Mo-2m-Kol15]|uniref:MFS transporter n=1 Tax=Polynucleobacter sp. UK-Mo-2m-Kol15 TaxID=2576916 RepID=UPI001C0E8095|nr:MFS transporter [Polynucleobacter sp. UK-Mo-2m-Kol15]MBU3574222.1 MHS family MFS transporter [Polynucleobacter sp. UK-Mo-2m-Kol15]
MSTSTKAAPMTAEERKVIFASSLGTVFEWYDFYLYGSLAAIMAKQFFSGLDAGSAFIFALLAFAAGFIVRPFGALVFGRLGDLIGRKYTFLVTILLMGGATFVVGCLPNYATIGVAAPVILIALRMLQGLALGGEYGGAATYVAEHAPHGKRGAYTAWIQTTATLGLFLSLLVILFTREFTGPDFDVWGWRVPFLLSIVLLGVSVYIRLSMNESPAFKKMKEEGKLSKAPLTESFGQWKNLKIVILALFGLVAGQAVVWYTGQFYALFYLTQVLKVDPKTANLLIAASLVIGTPFFVIFGSLSDRIGRKVIIMGGLLLAIILYIPNTPVSLFNGLTHFANPALEKAMATAPASITADVNECTFQFNPTGTAKFTSSCDIAKQVMASNSASYTTIPGPAGGTAVVKIGDTEIQGYSAKGMAPADLKVKDAEFKKAIRDALNAAGYPVKADPAAINHAAILGILVILVILVTMVYGPIAAMLVELFPTRIRYTSMSLPYHIGNGWFGGLMPTIAFALVAQNGNIYYGLWYPIIIAAVTLVIGTLFIKETKDVDIYAKD